MNALSDLVSMQAGAKYEPAMLEKIKQFLVQRKLISGLDQTKLACGIDTSHWTGPLSKELIAGSDFVCPKATDGYQVRTGNWGDLGTFIDDQFYNTVQLCYDAHVPCIPYHFFEWDYSADQWQIDKIVQHQFDVIKWAFRTLEPKKSYHGLVIDVEVLGDTDTNIRNKLSMLYAMLKNDAKFANVPVVFYTANWVLNTYPALRDWLSYKGAPYLLWLAQWVYTRAWTGTWDDFRAQVLPSINMSVITPGYANWTAVQWSASCKIHGFSIDVNSWNRTKEDLWNWLDFTTTPPDPGDPGTPYDDTELRQMIATLQTNQAAQQAVLDQIRTWITKPL